MTQKNVFEEDDVAHEGRLSFVLESTGGHYDNYDGKNTKVSDIYIESKITLCEGKYQHTSFDFTDNNFINMQLPLGALCYPLFGIFTNCAPLIDLETHALQNIVHLSKRNENNLRRSSSTLGFDYKHNL